MNTEDKLKFLQAHPHVVAIGDGQRIKNGENTGEKCTVYSVPKKVPEHMLSAHLILPKDGDVMETGIIKALDVYTDRYRPMPGGISIGHESITAGTLGCWVNYKDRKVMLSNNHVLANSNNAQLGDAILQPGPYDGGTIEKDKIGYLTDFVRIHFLGEDSDCPFSKAVAFSFNRLANVLGRKTRMQAIVPHADSNLVDAAIADVLDVGNIDDTILQIGKIHGIIEDPFVSMPVQKTGRTTGLTMGEIIQTGVVCQVQHALGRIAVFQGQLMAGAISSGGDSGSLVVSDDKAVGLLHAGSDSSTISSPIQHVMDALNINF